MDEPLTAVFEKSPHGYIGYIEEFPGVNTQGETLEEAKWRCCCQSFRPMSKTRRTSSRWAGCRAPS